MIAAQGLYLSHPEFMPTMSTFRSASASHKYKTAPIVIFSVVAVAETLSFDGSISRMETPLFRCYVVDSIVFTS